MIKNQTPFWKTFNTLGRIIGVCFILVGIVFVIWGVSLVANKDAAISVNGQSTHDFGLKFIVLIVGLVIATLGILLFKARPYKPD